ncbi:MAG: FliI/YscN family ATPase [Planctomycetota bacterium]
MSVLAGPMSTIERSMPMRVIGTVVALRGMTVLVEDAPLPVGSLVSIRAGDATPASVFGHGVLQRHAPSERREVLGEIVGFTREQAIVMPLGSTEGVRPGDRVVGEQTEQSAPVGARLLGRVLDGLGRPLDGMPGPTETEPRPIGPEPIGALSRRRIVEPMATGVRAIDLMAPMGRGQRLGVFAGPGVGKSTLLGMVARGAQADVNVIALIGERGREVRDFVEHSLGADGLARSVVIVATGDESPLLRLRAARYACTVAEWFREHGRDVLLMMDSVTRFAHAQRQVGLSVGEPPASKGYTPSVFAQLALLLERAGALEPTPGQASGVSGGSITGLYTILVEGDDMTEPVADAARGILDGHLVLSRRLAQRAHFPAIDVLDSVSRVADEVASAEHTEARRVVLRLLAAYGKVEDLVQIGAYAKGSNPESDAAIELRPAAERLLRQSVDELEDAAAAADRLLKLALQAIEMAPSLASGGVLAGERA